MAKASLRPSAPPRENAAWLTVKHAAEYLDFSSPRAFWQWAKREGIPSARRGRVLLFAKTDLVRAIGAAHRSQR